VTLRRLMAQPTHPHQQLRSYGTFGPLPDPVESIHTVRPRWRRHLVSIRTG
jgi:hypothetical protein